MRAMLVPAAVLGILVSAFSSCAKKVPANGTVLPDSVPHADSVGHDTTRQVKKKP